MPTYFVDNTDSFLNMRSIFRNCGDLAQDCVHERSYGK